jgi:digeranylgeranylglycerophospholipid reductase
MKRVSDVIVVGGGPCGSFAALKLAKLGANVTVFEEHSEVGVPCHCAGHLSIAGLKNLKMYPLPEEIVENTFCAVTFYSPKGREFTVRFSSPMTCVVNRALFDKYIAEKAEDAGVDFSLDSHVESLALENATVKGVHVRQKTKTKKCSKIVIDAEGTSSRILREVSLPGLDPRMIVKGVEAEVESVKDVQPDMVEVFLGSNYAPGLYAWLIPKKDGKAKVGLAAKMGNPKELLQRLMLKNPAASRKLRTARILKTSFHPITLGGPIHRPCSDAFLAVGDCASQVKPTTGGGVVWGLTCARLAADTAYEAICKDDTSSKFLKLYQKRCDEVLGFDARAMLRIRKLLDAMSDRQIDEAVGLCTRLGLDKALQNVKDIDFQGQSLLRMLRSPRMLTALGYFFYRYLCESLKPVKKQAE